jgi:hypothetical protein
MCKQVLTFQFGKNPESFLGMYLMATSLVACADVVTLCGLLCPSTVL